MGEIGNRYFTTGEFARLCGTTKETLFHYDEIGLLKPKKIRENGYRVYGSEQFFEYDLIGVLKRAGSSLKEIRWYLSHYDAENFLKILKQKKEQLSVQRREMRKMERMLAHTIETTEYALNETYDVPWIARQEEETLLVVPLTPGDGDCVDGTAARLREHFERCERCGLVEKFPLGSIILLEEVLAGGETESFFFSRASGAVRQDDLFVKPSGEYATIIHKGNYDSFSSAYQALLNFVREQGRNAVGNAYIYDLISYLAAGSQDSFVMQISVQVG